MCQWYVSIKFEGLRETKIKRIWAFLTNFPVPFRSKLGSGCSRGRDVKLPEAFQSSKRCFSWVVFGGMYLSDHLLDCQKIGTYLILFCLTQMKIILKKIGRRFGGCNRAKQCLTFQSDIFLRSVFKFANVQNRTIYIVGTMWNLVRRGIAKN